MMFSLIAIWMLWELASLSGPKWYGKTPRDTTRMVDAYDTKTDCERMLQNPLTVEGDEEKITIRWRCLPQGIPPR